MSIPASELAVMQAAANATLDQVCVIQRKHPVKDAYAGQSDGWQTLTQPGAAPYGGASTMCSMTQPSAQIMQNYDYLIGNLSAWVVKLPATAVIARDDQVLVGGQTLRVQAVLDLRSRLIDMHALVSEIR